MTNVLREVTRNTRETRVRIFRVEAISAVSSETGIPFFDHMLRSFLVYGNLCVGITCEGDVDVDDHHTVEDVAISLGLFLRESLITSGKVTSRFGDAIVPMDEALCMAAVDFGGRSYFATNMTFARHSIGGMSTENVAHFFRSFADASQISLHLRVLDGSNDHHKAECLFKAAGLAIRRSMSEVALDQILQTKGEVHVEYKKY